MPAAGSGAAHSFRPGCRIPGRRISAPHLFSAADVFSQRLFVYAPPLARPELKRLASDYGFDRDPRLRVIDGLNALVVIGGKRWRGSANKPGILEEVELARARGIPCSAGSAAWPRSWSTIRGSNG